MPLIYFWIVEDHHPKRVLRQFGMKQAPHAVYIDRWAQRGEHLADVPALDRYTTYLVAYMELYRRTTKQYITRESVY